MTRHLVLYKERGCGQSHMRMPSLVASFDARVLQVINKYAREFLSDQCVPLETKGSQSCVPDANTRP